MELIFSDPTYDSSPDEGQKSLNKLKRAIGELDNKVEFLEVDIGHGADWPVLLVTLGSIFLLGEKINKNLDAWLSIASKLATFITWAKDKLRLARIDKNAALLIAINNVVESEKFSSLEIIGNQTIPFSQFPNNPTVLSKTPDALYVISVQTNNKIIVYGIKSKGNIEFKKSFSTEWYEF